MTKQTLTVNLHRPRVQRIRRQDSGMLEIVLGNDEYNAQVTVMFHEDTCWHELQSAVNGFLTAEKLSADQYCPDCNYIGLTPDEVDQHIKRNHTMKTDGW